MATHPQLLADKAMGQFRQGQFNAAFKTARAGAKEHPRESFFFNLAGLAQVQGGNPREAIDWFRKAIRVSPGNMDAHLNLLQTYAVLGERGHATTLSERLLAKVSDKEPILYLRAMAESNSGDHAAAEATLNTLLTNNPNSARALNLRGATRVSIGKEVEAVADYQAALQINPAAPDTLSNLALLLSRAGRMEEALEVAQKAATVAPHYVLGRQRLATLLNEIGDIEAARATYFALLKDFPNHAETLLDLAYLDTDQNRAKLLEEVDAALNSAKKLSQDHANLMIARGRLLLRLGERAMSDQALADGRAAHARLNPFDAKRVERERVAVMAMFPSDYALPKGMPEFNPKPIFVLGLPRSGTTLLEHVISAHPDVYGAGELPGGERAARHVLPRGDLFDADAAQAFCAEYQHNLPALPKNTPAFIDKMPGNYAYVGMFLAAFPNATILHIERDPRDVGLSMWHAILGSPGMLYTYDQRQMARELNAYRRTMQHWKTLFADQIHTLRYEDLVTDIDGESRKAAAACGLTWVPEMARPHENLKAVRTASVTQVRQPVSTKSVGGWRRHEAALKDLIVGLDPTLWPEIAR